MANLITGIRVLASVGLLFCPALSPSFFALYLLAGLTDMIDGPVARKTHTATAFGAKLDTAADILFAAVCLVKLLPVLNIPLWMFIWIGLIALIKIINIVSGFVIRKRFVSVHTPMNKATGTLLFLLPLTVSCIDLRYTAPIVCAVATFAALQEGHLIRTGRRE
ncbi:MAG: CDP-alcohol phosphatidyltransferase family protein [Clostridia bacterium]|nr:CDP-alcohol phosphatidyltransferase family protein [Clostridia bacterium]